MPIVLNQNRIIEDRVGKSYEIGRCIQLVPDENPVRIRSVVNDEDKVFVEALDIHPGRYYIRKMSEKTSAAAIFPQMLWPDRLAQDYSGFIAQNPHIEGQLRSLNQIIQERKLKKEISRKEGQYYLSLGIQLAEIIQVVHNCGYIIGKLHPDRFQVSEDGHLYSCLSYRFSFRHTDIVRNPCYVAPEWLNHAGEKEIICDQSSDAFLYALILFGLLTGRHPFSFDRDCEEDDREELWERMCDGKSLYFWENPAIIGTLKEVLENTAPDADALFRRTFDYCGYETYGEDRPSVGEWLKCLKRYSDVKVVV